MQQQVAAERQREQVQTRGSSSRLQGNQTVSSARLDSLQSKKIEVHLIHDFKMALLRSTFQPAYSLFVLEMYYLNYFYSSPIATSECWWPENDDIAAVSKHLCSTIPRCCVRHSFALHGGDRTMVPAASFRVPRRFLSEICWLDSLRSSKWSLRLLATDTSEESVTLCCSCCVNFLYFFSHFALRLAKCVFAVWLLSPLYSTLRAPRSPSLQAEWNCSLSDFEIDLLRWFRTRIFKLLFQLLSCSAQSFGIEWFLGDL